ncbi:MAG: hypothetical protein WBA00_18380 [Rhodococcus sp. (in: high G+C Gram-positive bacteria)]
MSLHGGFSDHGTHDESPSLERGGSMQFSWRYLDADASARLWDEVTDWVWWLRDRYELGETIPRCWYRHGAVMEEFTALMADWKRAYSTGEGMSDWHSRGLWPLMDRLEQIAGFEQCVADGCSHESGFLHAPDGTETVMEPVLETAEDDNANIGAVVVGILTEDVMLSAVVSGEAIALDARTDRGRYHLGGRLWTWSSILGGYVPSADSHRSVQSLES